MNLVMVGTGYVGLVTGLGFAKLGHRVACVDVDAAKIAKLDMGQPPFFEVGLPELLQEMIEAGRMVFTTDLGSVIGGADIVMIGVGTPAAANGQPNLNYVFDAAREIGRLLDHEALVVMKSTVPVGTNRQVLATVRAAMADAGRVDLTSLVQIASLPEFLSEGTAIRDFFAPTRIVIGTDDEVARSLLERLHEGLEGPRVYTTIESAELVKLAANAFLATKISFINEMAHVAERTGADVREVARGIGLDPRIGPHFLRAGIGYGGSCLPKDVVGLHWMAGTNGYDFKVLSAVIETNNRQREQFARRVEAELGGLRGRKIACWGLSYKQGTDDLRESPAIDIVSWLFAHGAEVSVYDPCAMEPAKKILSDRVEFAPTAIDAAAGADALLVLTEWPEFRDVSFHTLKESMLEPRIFDGRNFLADLELEKFGFVYHGIGISR